MRIEGLNGLLLKLDVEKKEESNTSFSDLLQNFIKDVNNDLINAKNIEQDLSLGKIQNIQDAMYQIEKADISFRLLTEIRNKALESYQEIMRMQV
ncbi:flagellar hook-basal body complex subunit FliE [Sulfurihydrogenibium sp. YO3AOP1]|uniref:flagellar hook-basal body complex protein FliE n=1 Tax=Sulfurihydrogenibium sp. (strain YO3AOP1) TaxID=436114 RepID=UPI000172674B|nr:flagellar hook-basal body complex protein FliE [Sulfurihydrogenibium sp. YO3AOP1]ACD67241.1 flagellar hook-basal body complex subunit FliE [Sulfurihydrogenibium sp. YO3AOP1]